VIKKFVKFLSSIRLTIVALGASMVLIFFGTLAQSKAGIFYVMDTYFNTFWVSMPIGESGTKIPVFPGGYLIGTVLISNLIAAHITRFKFSTKKIGLWLIHFGLIMLLLGGLFTSMFQIETRMLLNEQESKNYSINEHLTELVFVTGHDDELDQVVSIPEGQLASGKVFNLDTLPFEVSIEKFYANSTLERAEKPGEAVGATDGLGVGFKVKGMPKFISDDKGNIVSALVELKKDGKSLGKWLVSNVLQFPGEMEVAEQNVIVDGTEYRMALRQKRYYDPFTIKLLDFNHDKYPGTEIPKDFSSRISLMQNDIGLEEERLIYMNHPLRYGGKTFYQASFIGANTTILQVVENPSWMLPYISCTIMTVGMVVQFMMSLVVFARKRSTAKVG
jgi:hypothetical protein